MDDAGFLSELAPVAEQQFARHVGAAKEWFPHEMVPWSRGRDFAEGETFDPDGSEPVGGGASARCC